MRWLGLLWNPRDARPWRRHGRIRRSAARPGVRVGGGLRRHRTGTVDSATGIRLAVIRPGSRRRLVGGARCCAARHRGAAADARRGRRRTPGTAAELLNRRAVARLRGRPMWRLRPRRVSHATGNRCGAGHGGRAGSGRGPGSGRATRNGRVTRGGTGDRHRGGARDRCRSRIRPALRDIRPSPGERLRRIGHRRPGQRLRRKLRRNRRRWLNEAVRGPVNTLLGGRNGGRQGNGRRRIVRDWFAAVHRRDQLLRRPERLHVPRWRRGVRARDVDAVGVFVLHGCNLR